MYTYARKSELFFSAEEVASWPPGCKKCRECGRVLSFHHFHRHKACLFGYNTVCKHCRVASSAKHYDESSYEYRLWCAARYRAKKKQLPFTIKVTDIVIPEYCPVLGVRMVRGSKNAPSIDRLRGGAGYVPGNIVVMSRRANALKGDATTQEIIKILSFMRKHGL